MDRLKDIKTLSDELLESIAIHLASFQVIDWVLDKEVKELIIRFDSDAAVNSAMNGLMEYEFIRAEAGGEIIVNGDYASLDRLSDRIDWHI